MISDLGSGFTVLYSLRVFLSSGRRIVEGVFGGEFSGVEAVRLQGDEVLRTGALEFELRRRKDVLTLNEA